MYILIVMTWLHLYATGYIVGPGTEFATKEACEAAAEWVVSHGHDVEAKCFSKTFKEP